MIAAAGPDAVVVADINSVRQAFSAAGAGASSVKPFSPLLTLNIGMRVSHVAFSADENYLVISAENGGGLAVYDVPAFMDGVTQPAFEMSTDRASLRAMVPNPTSEKADLFAIVTANGELKLVSLKTRQFINGPQGQTLKDGVSCVSWSFRGKQLVAGLGNGLCVQMTPEGSVKAEIPRPSNLEGDQHGMLQYPNTKTVPMLKFLVATISWLENDIFLIAHTPSTFDPAIVPTTSFHVVTRQKPPQIPFIFQKLPEPCPSSGTSRPPPYNFMQRLKDYPPYLQDLIIVVSTAAVDVGLISRSSVALTSDFSQDRVTKVFTTTTPANDSRRAQLPIGQDFADTSAIGAALDLSSKENVKRPLPGEELDQSPGPLPGLMVLNHEGVLCAWWIVYTDSIRQGKTYPGLVGANLQNQNQPQASHQGSSFPGASANPSQAFGQQPFGGNPSSANRIGNALKAAAPSFSVASTASTGGFGTSSGLGKPVSQWGTNASTGGTAKTDTPAFGQPSFGAPSAMGVTSRGPAFGQAGGIGATVSPWAVPSSGVSGTSGSLFGQTGGLGIGNPFGTSTSAATLGGFASFANAPGFAVAAAQGGADGGFAKATPGASFGSGMDTDVTFGNTPKKEDSSSLPENSGFVLGSIFKGDGTAANDLPKTSGNQTSSSLGTDFGESLDTPREAFSPPILEADMEDSPSENERSNQGSLARRESNTQATKPPAPKFQFPSTDPPPNGGFFGTQAQSRTTPASVQSSAPATSGWGKPTPFSTTPQETPKKPEVARPTIETTPRIQIKDEFEDDRQQTPKGISKSTPEPPESTSKASHTAGDTSNSSKSSNDDAPLPPDFLPPTVKAKKPESPHATLIPPALDGDDDLEDDEGSGVDVAQDMSPTTDPNPSPKITPGSSFGATLDKSPLGGRFTKVPHQQPQQNKLFGEISHTSSSYFPPPAKVQLSPRSPSPVRPQLIEGSFRPDNARSISAPGRPSKPVANRKNVPVQAVVESPSFPSLQGQRERKQDRSKAQQAQKSFEEDQTLSDREAEEIREELAQDVKATKTLAPFLAHQDYSSSVDKFGIPGQIETVYRDINSMLDTLGLNARSLNAFIKGHSELFQQGGRSRSDLEVEDWCLFEIADLGTVETQLYLQLEEGRMKDVQGKIDACRELRKDLQKIRFKRYEIAKVVNAKSDPEQVEAKRSAPLRPEQVLRQHDLRREFLNVQKLIADTEEHISVLKAKLATHQTTNGKAAPIRKPTVEAVTTTIKKMTSMVEKKSLDIDILEMQMRRLRFSVDNSESRESSPFLESPAASAKKGSELRKLGSNTPREPNLIANGYGDAFKGSPSPNGTPRKFMSSVGNREVERYRTKVERRKEINAIVKKSFLESGLRIRKLD